LIPHAAQNLKGELLQLLQVLMLLDFNVQSKDSYHKTSKKILDQQQQCSSAAALNVAPQSLWYLKQLGPVKEVSCELLIGRVEA